MVASSTHVCGKNHLRSPAMSRANVLGLGVDEKPGERCWGEDYKDRRQYKNEGLQRRHYKEGALQGGDFCHDLTPLGLIVKTLPSSQVAGHSCLSADSSMLTVES